MKLEYVNNTKNLLLRDFLANKISRKLLKDIKSNGKILVNDCEVSVRYILNELDRITIILPKEEKGLQMQPYYLPLEIVYEDDYILVINKQPHIACIPTKKHQTNTIAQGILFYYNEIGLDTTVHLVNRLDKETSGLMIVAKHRYIHYLFANLAIERNYMANVWGKLIGEGALNYPIGKVGSGIKRWVMDNGQTAITHYKTIYASDDYSSIECKLETGRTHQIRVHLAYIGHPIINDELYGMVNNKDETMKLCCHRLSFEHPVTGEQLKFSI